MRARAWRAALLAPVLLAPALLAGCATVPNPAPAAASTPARQPIGWTYGTAESAAIMRGTFGALQQAATRELARMQADPAYASALAAGPDGSLQPCTAANRARPAVVFDVDETLVWNSPIQVAMEAQGRSFETKEWERWERAGSPGAVAMPGAVDLLRALRAMGITPVFNTNRAAATASGSAAMMDRLGLGPAIHQDNLFLMGDVDGKSGKDARRSAIAARYCVLALAGDQLGDFADLFDTDNGARRGTESRNALAGGAFGPLWGSRWFMLPNPMYGKWANPPIAMDQLVPQPDRWTPQPRNMER